LEEHSKDFGVVMPKDVVLYLLRFCTINAVKGLAQMNKRLHGFINHRDCKQTFEVAANFQVSAPGLNGRASLQPRVV